MSAGNTQPQLRPTPVVTCFLYRTDRGGMQILIVQRSHKVGSYHEHWAGISGFIEPGVTPVEQAYTEIREETGLEQGQVHMIKYGEVVEHRDVELERHFYIHPFLCEVTTPERIRTDWEALAMRWIDPEDLAKYQTVPKLYQVYLSAIQGKPVS